MKNALIITVAVFATAIVLSFLLPSGGREPTSVIRSRNAATMAEAERALEGLDYDYRPTDE